MAKVIELSESEIVAALQSARSERAPDPPGAFVISELARSSHQAPQTIRLQIRALRAKGLIEDVKVARVGSDGRLMTVNAYRILKQAKR